MPFVPAPNTALVELVYSLDGQIIENTLYFENSAAPEPADLSDLGDAIAAWWIANMASALTNDLSLNQVVVTDLTTETSPSVLSMAGLPHAGAGSADALPNNVVLCISFRTDHRGKSARGRNFIPGLQENQTHGSYADVGLDAVFIAAYGLLIGPAAISPSWEWVVCSKFTGGNPRVSALMQPVTAVTVTDMVLDSQRRRLPGRGR